MNVFKKYTGAYAHLISPHEETMTFCVFAIPFVLGVIAVLIVVHSNQALTPVGGYS
jgi:hypothetical protein